MPLFSNNGTRVYDAWDGRGTIDNRPTGWPDGWLRGGYIRTDIRANKLREGQPMGSMDWANSPLITQKGPLDSLELRSPAKLAIRSHFLKKIFIPSITFNLLSILLKIYSNNKIKNLFHLIRPEIIIHSHTTYKLNLFFPSDTVKTFMLYLFFSY